MTFLANYAVFLVENIIFYTSFFSALAGVLGESRHQQGLEKLK